MSVLPGTRQRIAQRLRDDADRYLREAADLDRQAALLREQAHASLARAEVIEADGESL